MASGITTAGNFDPGARTHTSICPLASVVFLSFTLIHPRPLEPECAEQAEELLSEVFDDV